MSKDELKKRLGLSQSELRIYDPSSAADNREPSDEDREMLVKSKLRKIMRVLSR
jgi:hypothetical protein